MLSQHLLNEGKKVRIIVPNELIQKQTQQDLDLYISSNDIEVIVVEDLKYDKEDLCVYVVDEIDVMLEKSALIIKKDESGQNPEDLQHWAYGLVAV